MIESKLSGHWTDDQLIAHLYGVGPEDGHCEICKDCSARLQAMRLRQVSAADEPVPVELLAAQRRRIYARLTAPAAWRSRLHLRKLASATAAGLVIGGGLLYVDQRVEQQNRDKMLSDAQLVQDVSTMAESPEVQSIAPLQGLFEE